ncbi:MAG: cob(I)yrinic acid a,c-diamide adenosyltransferase [Calditrichaeota bacterium]|nr:cob(I)yrinic acid a,c-diamide adenosyltransferase [Calditrichota bacterium]
MKIYTGAGDSGQTSLYGGKRVSKSDLRIETYGTLDELNSFLGLLQSKIVNAEVQKILVKIQTQIFILSAEIATPDEKQRLNHKDCIEKKDIEFLEKTIDEISERLPRLKAFILPGGGERGAICHVTRTICRRAERNLIRWAEDASIKKEWMVYLNRLSDLLFVLARYLNILDGRQEIRWQGLG